MRTTIILLVIIAILSASLFGVAKYAQKQKSEKERQINNVYALSEELVQRVVQDSITVSQKRVMELKASEFERLFAKEAEKVKMLNIKLKNVQNIVHTEVVIRDTVRDIQVEYIKDSTIRFTHSDNFFVSLSGDINGSKLSLDYEAIVDIDWIQYREPKRFLGFLWRTKKSKCYKVEAFSTNPKVKIKGITAIKID